MEDILAKKIQLQYRITQFSKKLDIFKQYNLESQCKTLDFNQFKKIILDKKLLEDTKKMLISLNNYKNGIDQNPRMFITMYLIVYYSDDFLGTENDRHFSDNDIYLLSQNMLLIINNFSGNNINSLWNEYQNYNSTFKNWIKMDKERTIERAVVSFYHRSIHLEKIEADINMKNKDIEQLIHMKNELIKQQNDILKSIKIIDNTFDIQYLKENYKMIYLSLEKSWTTIITQLSQNMKKAYYNMLVEDLNKGNKLNTFNLIKEICNRIILISPEKRKLSLEQKLSDDEITELLLLSDWNVKLKDFILFIIDLVILLGASIDDKKNIEWKNKIINDMNKEEYNYILPKILIEIEEKIDRIYQLIIEFNEQIKNNK